MFTLHQTGLFIHFIALFLLGGATIGGIMVEKQVWQKALAGSNEGLALFPIMATAANMIKIGAILFIVSGLMMVGSVHWAYFTEPWFLIKVTLFFILAARGSIVAKPILQSTATLLNQNTLDTAAITRLRYRMNRFHIIQYSIAAAIILLVLFKPR